MSVIAPPKQSLETPGAVETLADVVDRLGGIPLERIAASPPPGTATLADVLANSHDHLYELVDGVLVEKAMGFFESTLAMVLGQLLRNFLDEHDLGTVGGEAGMLELVPGLVRGPDVSFIRWDRLPADDLSDHPVPAIAPDLAVEIISKGNTAREMERKRREYFAAGCRLVWCLHPKQRVVHVYTGPEECTVVRQDGILDGGGVLPGFSVRVGDWLAGARPRPRDRR